MNYEMLFLNPQTGLILLAGLVLLGLIAHFTYLERINAGIKRTADVDLDMKTLKSMLQVPQGSNFNTLALSSWSLLFVAFAFLYFLIPNISKEWNYFEVPKVASNDAGLFTFGLAVILLTGLLAFSIPRVYSYYAIPKTIKEGMSYLAPFLLIISIISSSYLATIYPNSNNNAWTLGYLTLFTSVGLLLLPIFSAHAGGYK